MILRFDALNELQVQILALNLSLIARRGDFISLRGDLGAGKTAFARAYIAALYPKESHIEIPSPTFSIMQTYPDARIPVHHFDFYRLGEPDEVLELGLEDNLDDGVVLAEWCEKISGFVPDDRLEVKIEMSNDPEARNLTLTGFGKWFARLQRYQSMEKFLVAQDWHGAQRSFLQGDASARRYFRLQQATETGEPVHAVFMDSPKAPDGLPVKDNKPYSQIAHLAESIKPFVAIGYALEEAGLKVPSIFAYDLDQGFILLEDLGNKVLGDVVRSNPDKLLSIYQSLLPLQIKMAQLEPTDILQLPDGGIYILPRVDMGSMLIEARLLVDWMYPALNEGEALYNRASDNFDAIWRHLLKEEIENGNSWVLRDFHSPNIMLLEDEDPIKRIGLIDFQDALIGPLAYDVVSLFQDARLDVPEEVQKTLLDDYCHLATVEVSGFNEEGFRKSYALMGAQRACKILGIFVRLAQRDGKKTYLQHIPRISSYLEVQLANPHLRDLKTWFDYHLPHEKRIELDKLQNL